MTAPAADLPTVADFLDDASARLDRLTPRLALCRHGDVDTVAAVRELHRIAALLAAALRLTTTPDPQRPDDRAPEGPMTTAARDTVIALALHEYADRLDAVPLDCTALTGPVWYGQGWRDAVNHLRDLADGLMPAPLPAVADGEVKP